MSCPLAKTPLAPVRAGCEWVVVEMGDTSGMFCVASAVCDETGSLVGGGLKAGPDIGAALCCVVMGIGATEGVDAGAGVTRDGVSAGERPLSHTGKFLSRGSTETLTGSLAEVIDTDVERSGTNAGSFGGAAEFLESVQPCCSAMRRALDISSGALTTVGTSGFQSSVRERTSGSF
jgi:hypothetical protein